MDNTTEGALILAKQSSLSFVGNIAENALKFSFLVVVTHLLSPASYGIFALGLSISMFLRGIVGLRLNRALDYFLPMYLAEGKTGQAKGTLLTAIKISVLTASIGAVLLAGVSGTVSRWFGMPALRGPLVVLSFVLVADMINDILFGTFNSIKRMDYRAITKGLIRPATQLFVSVGLIFIGFDVAGLVWGYATATIVTVLVGSVILISQVDWIHTGRINDISRDQLLQYSLPLAIAGVVYATIGQIDFFVIGFFLSADDVGHYRVAYLFAGNMLIIIGSFKPIFKPMVAESMSDTLLLRRRYRLATRWTMLFTIPIGVTILLAPGVYVTLFFSETYGPAQVATMVLVVGYLVNISFGLEGMVLEGLGYTRLTLLNTILTITANSVLDLLLVPRFGIEGAAIGTGLALIVGSLAGLIELIFIRGIHPYSLAFGKIVIAGSAAAGGGFAAIVILEMPPILTAITIPVIVGGTYYLSLIISNPFTEDDNKVAQQVDGFLGIDIVQRLIPSK